MRPMTLLTRRRLAVALAPAVLLVAASGGAATAQGDQHNALADNYTSLSATMLNFYASQSNQSLEDYLSSQQLLLVPSAFPGASVPGQLDHRDDTVTGDSGDPSDELSESPSLDSGTLSDLGSLGSAFDASSGLLDISALSGGGLLLSAEQAAQLGTAGAPLKASDVRSLSKTLSKAGLTVDTGNLKNVTQLAAAVGRASKSADGAVTLAASTWVSELAALNAPKLKNPGRPGSVMPTVPADALPMGLLMNKSLTNLVSNHPDLVAQAHKNGLGNKQLVSAWNTSMAQAYAASSGSLNSLLPNQCVGDMLAVMASGSATAAKASAQGLCSTACVTGGKYLHNASSALLNPNKKAGTSNPTSAVLQPGAGQGVAKANSTISTSPLDYFTTKDGCGAAANGAVGALSTTLPGIFSNLR